MNWPLIFDLFFELLYNGANSLSGYMLGAKVLGWPEPAAFLLAACFGAMGMVNHWRALRKTVVLLIFALGVTGCATTSPQLQAVEKFTEDDLQAALADAAAHNDQAGVTCWTTVLSIVQAAGNQSFPKIVGPASALQAKRDLLGQGGQSQLGDLKRRLNLGCAALFVDENAMLLKFGGSAFGIPSLP